VKKGSAVLDMFGSGFGCENILPEVQASAEQKPRGCPDGTTVSQGAVTE
jgi:hypothetical protein